MLTTHKIALDPTNVQATRFAQHAGYARVAWNWGVTETRRALDAGEKSATSHYRLRPLWNRVKDELFPWCREHSQFAAKCALIDLSAAWERCFTDAKKDGGRKVRRPKFHSRKRGQSFRADNGRGIVRIETRPEARPVVVLPRIGAVRLCEAPRFDGPIVECTIVRTGSRWFAACVFDVPDPEPRADGAVVGVDVGLRKSAVAFDGGRVRRFANPRPLGNSLTRLKRANRKLARSLRIHGKDKPSNRRKRVVGELRRLHARIACVRNDHAAKSALAIAKTARTVVVETLNVDGWKRLRTLARSTSDAAPAGFLTRLKKTCARLGVNVVEVPRFYPSSKTCSACGAVNGGLGMDERWRCPSCGAEHDRDANAAVNLWRQGLPSDVEAVLDARQGAVACEASTGQGILECPR